MLQRYVLEANWNAWRWTITNDGQWIENQKGLFVSPLGGSIQEKSKTLIPYCFISYLTRLGLSAYIRASCLFKSSIHLFLSLLMKEIKKWAKILDHQSLFYYLCHIPIILHNRNWLFPKTITHFFYKQLQFWGQAWSC